MLTSTSLSSTQIGLTISGGTCSPGNQVTLSFNPTQLTDTVGNVSTSSTVTSIGTYTIAILPPIPGTATIIQSKTSSPSSWNLSWTAATSQTSSTSQQLLYQVVAYTSAIPNNATNAALSTTTVVLPWTSTSSQGSPLTPTGTSIGYATASLPTIPSSTGSSAPYYFAVLVKDPFSSGLISYYPTSAATPVDKYVYFVDSNFTPAFGGVAGADTKCQGNRPTLFPTTIAIKALLVDGVKRAAPYNGVAGIDWVFTPSTTYYYSYAPNALMGTTDANGIFSTPPLPAPAINNTQKISFWTGLGGGLYSDVVSPYTTSPWSTSPKNCRGWTSNVHTSDPLDFATYGVTNEVGGYFATQKEYPPPCLISTAGVFLLPMYLLCVQQ